MTPGTEIPMVFRTPDAVDLFLFSATALLIHRIHYDLPFTVDHDGHPGLLIHGPLQGTYMVQAAQEMLGPSARLRSITYRHLSPAYLGDSLACGGSITETEGNTVTLELWIRKGEGTITTTGTAVFEVST
mgnify:CR=1 FL=1